MMTWVMISSWLTTAQKTPPVWFGTVLLLSWGGHEGMMKGGERGRGLLNIITVLK